MPDSPNLPILPIGSIHNEYIQDSQGWKLVFSKSKFLCLSEFLLPNAISTDPIRTRFLHGT
jgi:hypothetical protein